MSSISLPQGLEPLEDLLNFNPETTNKIEVVLNAHQTATLFGILLPAERPTGPDGNPIQIFQKAYLITVGFSSHQTDDKKIHIIRMYLILENWESQDITADGKLRWAHANKITLEFIEASSGIVLSQIVEIIGGMGPVEDVLKDSYDALDNMGKDFRIQSVLRKTMANLGVPVSTRGIKVSFHLVSGNMGPTHQRGLQIILEKSSR